MSQRQESRSTTGGPARLQAIHAEPLESSYLVSVLSHTADGMVAIDTEGCILGWNAAAEGLFGYPAEDVIGRACNEVLDFRRPLRQHSVRCGVLSAWGGAAGRGQLGRAYPGSSGPHGFGSAVVAQSHHDPCPPDGG